MDITPDMVKELRERTGAGMMDCKRALVETNGDPTWPPSYCASKASEGGQEGLARGRRRTDRDQERPAIGRHAIVEVNSETDFVAKDENFRRFVDVVANVALSLKAANVAELMQAESGRPNPGGGSARRS